jgi:hypothetical protein
MPIDRTLITLSELVHRAAAVADPDGADAAVAELVERHDDDDEPVRGILDELEERLAWGADEDPPIVMTQAVVLYLAHRLDEFDEEPTELLRLAARAELDDPPPAPIAAWLAQRGVEPG